MDLTVTVDGRRFWVEIKYTDKDNLKDALAQGDVSLQGYRAAAAIAKDLHLDANLGGWQMREPDGYGKIACNQHHCKVQVDGLPLIDCSWQPYHHHTPLRTAPMR